VPVPFAALLVPTAGASEDDARATVAAARAELPDGTPFVALAGGPAGHDGGLPTLEAADALAAAELLVPLRPGDRWRDGALVHRLRPMRAHPTAALGIAGHERVDAAGRVLFAVAAPLPGTPPSELVLRTSVEASAVVLRTAALAPAELALLARPFGDGLLWRVLAARHGVLPSGELAAAVRVDAGRHGHDPATRIAALRVAAAPDGADGADGSDDPGDATLRRELLRRLHVEPVAPAGAAPLAELLAPAARADPHTAAVLADVDWVLARQAEALATERLRWADGELGAAEPTEPPDGDELAEANAEIARLHREVIVRDRENARLHAEIARREAILERLGAGGPA
jgi:hypothetical protein